MIDIVETNKDFTLAYLDGEPIVVKAKKTGGRFLTMRDGDYIKCKKSKCYWFVNQSSMWKTCDAKSGRLFEVWSENRRRRMGEGSAIAFKGRMADLA